MIKVLSIHWGFSVGGIVKYAQLIDNVFHQAPIKIFSIVILGDNWDYDKNTLEKISAKTVYIKNRYDFSWISKSVLEIDSLRPQIIMTHGFNGHFVAAITRMRTKTKPRYICSYHGSYYAFTPIRKVFQRLINNFTEAYIRYCAYSCVAVSKFTKQSLLRKGVVSSKIEVIYNGIRDEESPIKFRRKFRKDWGVQDSEILLGVTSRLDPFKGIEYLIDAFYVLCKKITNCKLVIIGSGTIEKKLKEKVIKCGLNQKVIFTGFRSEVPKCLLAIDIFILPSLAENHSIGLIEAMRAGKAIIATNVGGNTESVCHLKEGLIIPAANSKSLIDAIEKLVEHRSLAETLGKSAREKFKKTFTEEIMVRKTAQWLVKCATHPTQK
ncbi:MAG TPA: hypothetical protein DDX98_05400 [Bacteroidales bacterium]|nr:hypothetical protein [Bacteroidales bacterium]